MLFLEEGVVPFQVVAALAVDVVVGYDFALEVPEVSLFFYGVGTDDSAGGAVDSHVVGRLEELVAEWTQQEAVVGVHGVVGVVALGVGAYVAGYQEIFVGEAADGTYVWRFLEQAVAELALDGAQLGAVAVFVAAALRLARGGDVVPVRYHPELGVGDVYGYGVGVCDGRGGRRAYEEGAQGLYDVGLGHVPEVGVLFREIVHVSRAFRVEGYVGACHGLFLYRARAGYHVHAVGVVEHDEGVFRGEHRPFLGGVLSRAVLDDV